MESHSSILAWEIPQTEENVGYSAGGRKSWTRCSYYTTTTMNPIPITTQWVDQGAFLFALSDRKRAGNTKQLVGRFLTTKWGSQNLNPGLCNTRACSLDYSNTLPWEFHPSLVTWWKWARNLLWELSESWEEILWAPFGYTLIDCWPLLSGVLTKEFQLYKGQLTFWGMLSVLWKTRDQIPSDSGISMEG